MGLVGYESPTRLSRPFKEVMVYMEVIKTEAMYKLNYLGGQTR